VRALVEAGMLRVVTGVKVAEVMRTAEGIAVVGERGEVLTPVDEIIVTTGFRPDLTPLRELRLGLDPALESPATLAPLIDPNVHSCGTVPPHGAQELAHPEKNVYIVGVKSYGRAPTFLLLTGYEQVRSVVAALAGDWESARARRLVLPETGVCSSGIAAADGSPSPACGGEPSAPALVAMGAADAGRPATGDRPVAPFPPREALSLASLTSVASFVSVTPALPILGGADIPALVMCCSPVEQETCCDPSDKAPCCGAAPVGSCGCR